MYILLDIILNITIIQVKSCNTCYISKIEIFHFKCINTKHRFSCVAFMFPIKGNIPFHLQMYCGIKKGNKRFLME